MFFSIGELSKRTGVKVPTIRYYEKEGLIAEPVRTEGNQRRYTGHDLKRLVFIKHARDLGLAMEAIRHLLDLRSHPDEPCKEVHQIASSHLQVVHDKILQLQKLEQELRRILSSCDGEEAVARCHVIEAFSDHSLCNGEH